MSFPSKFASALSLCAAIALVSGCTDAAAPKKTEPAKPAKAPEAGSSTGGGTKVPEKK
ncbi:MAG: hypothetical protein AB7O26_07855 [Planctomycetaceae bacterium]